MTPARSSARVAVERACAAPGGDRELRAAVLAAVRRVVPFDSYAFVLTDPVTCVGASPLAEVPTLADLPALVRLKYLGPLNRWTTLPATRPAGLAAATAGDLARSDLWRDLLRHYDTVDVASAVLRDRHGCWAFLDLHRAGPGATPFDGAELDFLAALLPGLTAAVRARQAATFALTLPAAPPDGPAVLLYSDTLAPLGGTSQAEATLRALLPTPAERAPVPAAAMNAAAQLLAVEAGVDDHPPRARLHLAGGRWAEVRAARLGPSPAPIAVTIERVSPEGRLDVYCRAAGLSPRETELLGRLAGGADTRAVARSLGITEHTVNDHLRSVFARTGTHSRRELVARARG